MVRRCKVSGGSLQEQEQAVFPLSHTEALAQLLATWNVPADVRSPLSFLLKDYQALIAAPEPIRTKAEFVKIAAFVGRLAVGRWESWDLIEVPPAAALKRLGIHSIGEIVAQARSDVDRLARFRSQAATTQRTTPIPPPSRQLGYCDLSELDFDLVGMLLPSMGITPLNCAEAEIDGAADYVLVNCIGAEPHRLSALTGHREQLLILTDVARPERYQELGRTIALPASYCRLRSACWESSRTVSRAIEQTGSIFAHWA